MRYSTWTGAAGCAVGLPRSSTDVGHAHHLYQIQGEIVALPVPHLVSRLGPCQDEYGL
jgi:hypothetical protein